MQNTTYNLYILYDECVIIILFRSIINIIIIIIMRYTKKETLPLGVINGQKYSPEWKQEMVEAGVWLSHLLSEVFTVQSPPVGVVNWPKHTGAVQPAGVVLHQPHRRVGSRRPAGPVGSSMSLCCFYSGLRVKRSKWLSVWVGVKKKKKEPAANKGMFQAHGGLFVFRALECIWSSSRRIYKVMPQSASVWRVGFTNWFCTSVKCEPQKASVERLAIWQQEVATRTLQPLKLISLLNLDEQITTLLLCLCPF